MEVNHFCTIPGITDSGLRVYARCVTYKVVGITSFFSILYCHVAGKLIDNCANHFKVGMFFGAYMLSMIIESIKSGVLGALQKIFVGLKN